MHTFGRNFNKSHNTFEPTFFYPRQCYVKMSGYLRDVCVTHELTLNISHLHLDFEIADHEAARQLWSEIIIDLPGPPGTSMTVKD